MTRFVPADRDQPFLLPPNLRDWVPEDDLAHFIIEAVARVAMAKFKVNHRGTGSAQYDPRLMLALIVYCYAHGIFSSRKIERATRFDVRIRFVSANTHPDHDTIAAFRRDNFDAIAEAFLQVLQMALELKLLKVGTISVDGTKINANANIHKSIRYDRAVELRAQLKLEIAELMKKAEQSDRTDTAENQSLPKDIARREALRDKLDAAIARLEAEAKARSQAARDEKMKSKKIQDDQDDPGPPPVAASGTPLPEQQTNLTDPESRIMRQNRRSEYRQAFNAQAGVDADGSQMILGTGVSQSASDKNELVPIVDIVTENAGKPSTALADTGYANGEAVAELEQRGIDPLVAVAGGSGRRAHDFRPAPPPKPAKEPKAPWLVKMKARLQTDAAKAKYKLRKQTVEPVFGIIKQAMGFRQFLLRGIAKVRGEWQLVALAYNCRRLHTLVLGQTA